VTTTSQRVQPKRLKNRNEYEARAAIEGRRGALIPVPTDLSGILVTWIDETIT